MNDAASFVGTLPQPRRDFSSVDYDEAMRRARAAVPVLRERARASEDARVLTRENEQLLHETGLFRFHQPKAFGGMELPFVALIDIVDMIARGCPSTAWNVGNLGCHHWILGYYHPDTQHEVWDANPDTLIASSIALAAGRARKVEGGFIVSGRWPFSSGVDNSDWNMLAATVFDGDKPVDSRLCVVPKADYQIIDTWDAMGMQATGSKDVAAREVFVPDRRALALGSAAADMTTRAARSIAARCSAFRSSAPRAIRWRRPRSARRKARSNCFSPRWRSGQGPIPAPRWRISRRCRSRSPARAA